MKARYLTFFSYIGSTFRKIWLTEGRNYPDPESVQGLMERALLKLKSINYPNVILSSRTDGGVHALNSSAHFDLDRFGSKIYDANNVAYNMNKSFFSNNIPIYVKQCLRVNDDFHARFLAIRRTYLYRLAVLKQDVTLPQNLSIASFIPIEEWKRCHFIRLEGFNIDRFKEGAKCFEGLHDWTTFKRFDKLKQHKHNRREIYSVVVRPGRPTVTYYTLERDSVFTYWDIEIQGGICAQSDPAYDRYIDSRGHRQTGAQDIQVMLQVPSKHSWHNHIQAGPPDGLYLCNVEYSPRDLEYNPDRETAVETQDNEEDYE